MNQEIKLAELMSSIGKIQNAPTVTRREGKWHQVTIGIGNDHSAHITIHDEDLKVLCERNNITLQYYYKVQKCKSDKANTSECRKIKPPVSMITLFV